MMLTKIARFLNSLMAITLMGILLAAYYQQYFKHELPCPLCILQRLAMIGISIGALFNLRFGIHTRFYSLSLISALFGASVSLRQISLHVCPGFPPFGLPVFGLSLYTWAFIAFVCSMLGVSLLMLLYTEEQRKPIRMNLLEKGTLLLVFTVTLMNAVTTAQECGIGPCADVQWFPREEP